MIHKETLLPIVDSSGISIVKVFHLYGGFKKRYAKVNTIIHSSVRRIKKQKLRRRKKKVRCIYLISNFRKMKRDGSYIFLKKNGGATLKKRMFILGRIIYGPVFFKLRRKKLKKALKIMI